MKDPLAPPLPSAAGAIEEAADPYSVLGLSSDATAKDADARMGRLLDEAQGGEMDIIIARDTLSHPSRRLVFDFFRYDPPDGASVSTEDTGPLFDEVLAAVRNEMRQVGASIQFGPKKTVLPVDEFEK